MNETPIVQNFNQPHAPDHDLLITFKAEVSTKLDRVIMDVKDLKDDLIGRVKAVEDEKLSKDEFDDYRTQVEKERIEYKRKIEQDRIEYKEAADRVHEDQESRLRYVLKLAQYGIGAIGTIQFLTLLLEGYKLFHP
jgi:hypothetical protein